MHVDGVTSSGAIQRNKWRFDMRVDDFYAVGAPVT